MVTTIMVMERPFSPLDFPPNFPGNVISMGWVLLFQILPIQTSTLSAFAPPSLPLPCHAGAHTSNLSGTSLGHLHPGGTVGNQHPSPPAPRLWTSTGESQSAKGSVSPAPLHPVPASVPSHESISLPAMPSAPLVPYALPPILLPGFLPVHSPHPQRNASQAKPRPTPCFLAQTFKALRGPE